MAQPNTIAGIGHTTGMNRVGLNHKSNEFILTSTHYVVLRVHTSHITCEKGPRKQAIACEGMHHKLSGGYYGKVTPVPIPNTAVKLASADDTWTVASRESRSPPDLYQDPVG